MPASFFLFYSLLHWLLFLSFWKMHTQLFRNENTKRQHTHTQTHTQADAWANIHRYTHIEILRLPLSGRGAVGGRRSGVEWDKGKRGSWSTVVGAAVIQVTLCESVCVWRCVRVSVCLPGCACMRVCIFAIQSLRALRTRFVDQWIKLQLRVAALITSLARFAQCSSRSISAPRVSVCVCVGVPCSCVCFRCVASFSFSAQITSSSLSRPPLVWNPRSTLKLAKAFGPALNFRLLRAVGPNRINSMELFKPAIFLSNSKSNKNKKIFKKCIPN